VSEEYRKVHSDISLQCKRELLNEFLYESAVSDVIATCAVEGRLQT